MSQRETNPRHIKNVYLPSKTLGEMLKLGMKTECIEGLPPDAKIVCYGFCPTRLCLFFTAQHPSFEYIQMAQEIPECKVNFQFGKAS
jgi:hypothetical protein